MKSGFITFLTLAAVACQGAAEALEANGDAPAATPAAGGEAPRRRGRPPGGGAAAGPAAGAATEGPTDAERYDANRKLIDPLVKGGSGEEVKKVIAKYSKTGLKDVPAANQADFEKDIEALSY